MKVSFVIPAHNEEKLLPGCLRSIQEEIKRSGCEAEVIVASNASTDRTAKIAQEFGTKVVEEPRKGVAQARQTGFEASTGELIANVDADTVVPEGWLATVVEEFSRDPKLVALSGPYIHYDFSPFMRLLVRAYYRIAMLGGLTFLQGGNFVLRRDALERVGGFDTSLTFWGEDTDIAKRMRKAGRVKFTFKLPMYTTARRMKSEGLIKTTWLYVLNFFSITFLNRPATREYADVRMQ